ncbi:MAG: hypothetical protein QOG42_1109 [Solirubrobacteraceae bacterium]|jgi:hypothetical protein|nr:hypothetical protein [Solirubrobacteraceae bacterium]
MRHLAIVSACLLAAVVAAGCGSGATTNCKVPPDRALLLAVRAHAGPIKLPNGPDKGNAARLTITACQTSSTEATATMTVFGLKDSSTLDIRHGMKLEFKNGRWIVSGDAHTRRCQPGHGNQEFGSSRCR